MEAFLNTNRLNNSFARYFIEQNKNIKLKSKYEFVPIDFEDITFYLHHENQGVYLRYKEWLRNADQSKTYVYVIDKYTGIGDPSLLPVKCIIFTSNEGCNSFLKDKHKKVIYIPLLNNTKRYCQSIPVKEREYLFSFVGKMSHPIRKKVMELKGGYVSKGGMNASQRLKHNDFYELIANSVFTLCPRGINWSSYRICEALRYGSIPVYISDNYLLPEGFEKYGLVVAHEELNDLPKRLRSITSQKISEMIDFGSEYYDNLYTFEGLSKWIVNKINEF